MTEKNFLTPIQAVYKAYMRSYVSDDAMRNFIAAMRKFFESYDKSQDENHNKLFIHNFLKESFYNGTNAINSADDADYAIYATERSRTSVPVVLIEAKHVNNVSEMVLVDNINRKALHELVLYYILEEEAKKNYNIKNLIITDGYRWFIFDKKVFLDSFIRDRKFVKQVMDMEKSHEYNRPDIYQKLIKPKVEEVQEELVFTYFDISRFENRLDDEDIAEDKALRGVYKVLSPVHLLQLPFIADHNTINRRFYNELLYILGLHEEKDKNSGLLKIKRLPASQQQYFSMLEQAMQKLEDYGIKKEDEKFEIALGLVIEWINRFLFLKLLEAQLQDMGYKKQLMTSERIPDYCAFYELCMRILAKPYNERTDKMNELFGDVPYLNSSLFELSESEKKYFSINAICTRGMKVYPQTVVLINGKKPKDEISSLDYLFRFLASYNYGADSLETKEADTIISASVLGLIFEKINGYKDGAFFTPGYVTEYMCHDVIRKAVVDKFNEVKGWQCKDFEELKECIDYGNRDVRCEANDIVNQIKICDPAVGSGHFLVSALNELILVKAELRILQDHTEVPNRIKEYKIHVESDELVLLDEDNKQFKYRPSSVESQTIQRALFEEKRTIIENCLFGVDLNPKSVDICRLRLWIELLKNAYYYNDNGVRHLQTLPNIDINIKHGNSLLSKFPVRSGKSISSEMLTEESLKKYFDNVAEFKNCSDKVRKADIRKEIEDFKLSFEASGYQQDLFGQKKSRKKIVGESHYAEALEWMIEFPEVLSDKGVFKGFDVIIGNPPYVSLGNQKDLSGIYQRMVDTHDNVYSTYDSKGDLYILFVERALSLLKEKGRLSFIIPNKWMKIGAGRGLRHLLSNKDLTELVDFKDHQIFPEATTYTCIVNIINQDASDKLRIANVPIFKKDELKAKAEEAFETFSRDDFNESIWVTSSVKKNRLLKEIQKNNSSLEDYCCGQANIGLITGLTDAFVISEEKKEQLIEADDSAKDILRPMLRGKGMIAFQKPTVDQYLVFLPKGFTKKGMGIPEDAPKPSEKEAWEWVRSNYPSIASHMEEFEGDGKKRSDSHKGDYWWELRACTYYEEFCKPKIMYQVMPTKPCFIYNKEHTFCNNSVWFIQKDDKALLALLNSKVAWWLMNELCPMIQNGCQLIWDNFKLLPIPRKLPELLATLADELMAAKDNNDDELFDAKYEELNEVVREAYNID